MSSAFAPRLQVPYVTAYDGEDLDYALALAPSLEATDGIRLSYADPVDTDWLYGVLWHRHGMSRSGRPVWKLVNTNRQRRCMLRLLCQVCGQSARDSNGAIWWVMTEPPTPTGVGDLSTNAPPTCRRCIPVARRSCPRLRESMHIYTSTAAEPYAVMADVFKPSGRGVVLVREVTEVPLDAFHDLEYALAKQLLVKLEGLQPAHI